MEVKGSIALVTGANRGIGEACVEALLEAGAERVYAAVRVLSTATPLVEGNPDKITPIALDITQLEQVKAAAETCKDVNLLVNNAGVSSWPTGYLIASPNTDDARLEIETNYFGTLEMCRAFAPVLGANGGGAIVNILSSAALVNVPPIGTYSASKAAAASMTQGVRAELRDQGTFVSAIFVGSVDTRMAENVVGPKVPPSQIGKVVVNAVAKQIEDVDSDIMAIDLRAGLARDPKKVERQMYRRMKLEKGER